METQSLMQSIELRKGKGRCFIARKVYEPSDVILMEEAYASIISKNYMESACLYCGSFPISTAYTLSSTDDSR